MIGLLEKLQVELKKSCSCVVLCLDFVILNPV